jgi:hypothetical protein
MIKHKWHKEIKAWADGEQIESKNLIDDELYGDDWNLDLEPLWDSDEYEFRIKPKKSDSNYLYVYQLDGYSIRISQHQDTSKTYQSKFLGKIKLEVDDD